VRRNRGQALVEFALVVPVLLAFTGIILQFGLLASDQVNLDHFAYEGTQWAQANNTTATTGSIHDHVMSQMCGTDPAVWYTSAAATRYCQAGGAGKVTVTVTAPPRPSAWLPSLVVDAEAKKLTCKPWTLNVTADVGAVHSSDGNGVTVAQGGTAVIYSVTLSVGAGAAQDKDPLVTISMSGFPPGVVPAYPLPNPAAINSSGTSQASFAASATTPTGPFTLQWGGTDQCGQAANRPGNLLPTTLTVTGSAPSVPCPNAPVPNPASPSALAVVAATTQTVTINGSNFQNGAVVSFGSFTSPLVVVTGSNRMVVVVPPAITPGVYTISVTNPDNCVGQYNNGLTICTSGTSGACAAPPTPPPAVRPGCAPASGDYEVVIAVTFKDPLLVPWIAPSITLTASQTGFCQ